MGIVPDHLKRYPTGAGRRDLAARLGLTVDPRAQDWEWEVAESEMFYDWLAVYRSEMLSDDERFSLMEVLIQCVEDTVWESDTLGAVEGLPRWEAVAVLLSNDTMEHLPWKEIHDLSEQRLADIHASLRKKDRKTARFALRRSNRRHPSSLGNPHLPTLSALHPLFSPDTSDNS